MHRRRQQKPSVRDPIPALQNVASPKSRVINLSKVTHGNTKSGAPTSLDRELLKGKVGLKFPNRSFIAAQMGTVLGAPAPKQPPTQPPVVAAQMGTVLGAPVSKQPPTQPPVVAAQMGTVLGAPTPKQPPTEQKPAGTVLGDPAPKQPLKQHQQPKQELKQEPKQQGKPVEQNSPTATLDCPPPANPMTTTAATPTPIITTPPAQKRKKAMTSPRQPKRRQVDDDNVFPASESKLGKVVLDMDINWKYMFGDDGASLGISWEADDSALFESQPLTEREILFMEEVLEM